MTRNRTGGIAVVAVTLAVAWACAGRAQDPDAGKKVGGRVDDAIQDVKGGLRKAGAATRDQFARAKTSAHNMGVESRIYGRLHWDKALNDASIDLSGGEAGVFTLTGTVADARAKVKAVELTMETVGVTKVIDQLAIRPTPVESPRTSPGVR